MLRIAALPLRSGQQHSCCTLPHCLGALGSGTLALHCRTAREHWAVELFQHTAIQSGGIGQWNSSNIPPHYLVAVGSGTLALDRRTARGQRAADFMLYIAALLRSSGQ